MPSSNGPPVTVDGRLDEPSWAAATQIDSFSFPWWTEGERKRTEARMLWDDEVLYVSFRAFDSHVSAVHKNRDDPVSRDDCVEVFIAPDTTDVSIYFNFEFNALSTILDRSPNENRRSNWNADSLRVAIDIHGTLNQQDDIDSLWTTEISIPFDTFTGFAPRLPPSDGDIWRLNLYRTGGAINLQYATWSDTKKTHPPVPRTIAVRCRALLGETGRCRGLVDTSGGIIVLKETANCHTPRQEVLIPCLTN